jgi:hypothetical protein
LFVQDAAKVYTYRLLKAFNIFGYNDSGMVPNHPNHLINAMSSGSIHMQASQINQLNHDVSSGNLLLLGASEGGTVGGGGATNYGAPPPSTTNRKNSPSFMNPPHPAGVLQHTQSGISNAMHITHQLQLQQQQQQNNTAANAVLPNGGVMETPTKKGE